MCERYNVGDVGKLKGPLRVTVTVEVGGVVLGGQSFFLLQGPPSVSLAVGRKYGHYRYCSEIS